MDARGSCRALFVVGVLLSVGCETTSYDNGPSPVCVGVGGVWDVTMVGEAGSGIACPDRTVVWTIHQNACDITIEAESWDTANGATGGVSENRLYAEWIWFEGCYRYGESIDVTVDGDTITGKYYMSRGQAVYPAYCPGLGICSAALNGTRRAAP